MTASLAVAETILEEKMNNVYLLLELQINDGQTENFKQLMKELVTNTEANEPGTLNYEWNLSSDGKTVHVYERYADSAAIMTHLGAFANFVPRFMEVFSPIRLSVYGSPNDEVKEAVAAFGPEFLAPAGGFSR